MHMKYVRREANILHYSAFNVPTMVSGDTNDTTITNTNSKKKVTLETLRHWIEDKVNFNQILVIINIKQISMRRLTNLRMIVMNINLNNHGM